MTRRVVVAALQAVSLSIAATALAAPTQVRVVWTEDPAHKAVVSWTTPTASKATELLWDVDVGVVAADYLHTVRPQLSAAYDDDEPQFYHHAALTGLEPGQTVHFRIVADGETTRDFWFKAAPDDSSPFALLYGGDSRSDSKARRRMNQRIAELVRDDRSILALAHGGDYIATGSSWPQWHRWLEDWQLSFGSDGRVLPIIPTRGNHEGDGELFNRVFAFPGSGETDGDWFATQIGRDFVLLTLDSNVSLGGVQRKWLDQALKVAQSNRWISAGYHRPAYPAVKSPGGALEHWVPLFEQYNVDFVFESDGHVLKRTLPIRAAQPDPTGVVYLGEGGLGVPQRTPDTDRWYLKPPGMAMSAHHVQLLRVSPGAVVYTAVDIEGEVVDRYEFTPKRLGHSADAPTIRELPVGKPPPPAPPASGCSTAGTSASGWWAFLFAGFAFLVGRRRPK